MGGSFPLPGGPEIVGSGGRRLPPSWGPRDSGLRWEAASPFRGARDSQAQVGGGFPLLSWHLWAGAASTSQRTEATREAHTTSRHTGKVPLPRETRLGVGTRKGAAGEAPPAASSLNSAVGEPPLGRLWCQAQVQALDAQTTGRGRRPQANPAGPSVKQQTLL